MEERRGKLRKANKAIQSPEQGTDQGERIEDTISSLLSVVRDPESKDHEKLTALRLLAQAYEKTGALDRQEEMFLQYLSLLEAVDGKEEACQAAIATASRLARGGEYLRAIDYARLAYTKKSSARTSSLALHHIGKYFESLNDYNRALETHRYVAATYPETDGGRRSALRVPFVLVNMHKTDQAISAYERLLDSVSTDAEKAFCLLRAGMLQEMHGQHDDRGIVAAIKTYNSLVDRFPSTSYAKDATQRLRELQSLPMADPP